MTDTRLPEPEWWQKWFVAMSSLNDLSSDLEDVGMSNCRLMQELRKEIMSRAASEWEDRRD